MTQPKSASLPLIVTSVSKFVNALVAENGRLLNHFLKQSTRYFLDQSSGGRANFEVELPNSTFRESSCQWVVLKLDKSPIGLGSVGERLEQADWEPC